MSQVHGPGPMGRWNTHPFSIHKTAGSTTPSNTQTKSTVSILAAHCFRAVAGSAICQPLTPHARSSATQTPVAMNGMINTRMATGAAAKPVETSEGWMFQASAASSPATPIAPASTKLVF